MAKEESGRLFAKVAKFVRNPLKDWSELDEQGGGGGAVETGYSREMLKEMIERRQRNDFVRRREFDMLRKLRRREATGGADDAHPSSYNINSTSGKDDGRALTLKKIDEIEQQMSQQWWKGGAAPAPDAPPSPAVAPAAAAGADEERTGVASEPTSDAGLPASRLVANSAIEEAAIRFAQGDDSGAEAILLQALSPDSPTADHDQTWLALLDLYRAIGHVEKFGASSTRFAQRHKRPGPAWVSLRALAHEAQSMRAAMPPAAPRKRHADWVCPPRITRAALGDLTQALGAAGAVWTLDWSALRDIEADAAPPLKALFAHWAASPVHLRFQGGERLLEQLEEQTPLGERGREVIWWQLRMDALRAMNRPDDYELAGLNYCITYEVSPPPWDDPKGRYEAQDSPAITAALALQSDAPPDGAESEDVGHVALSGELTGEALSTWARLDVELEDATTPTISCAALVRLDFAAAGSLLNWVMARDGSGQRVHFVDVHRLIAPFFHVIGITDHATVAVRAD